MTLARTIDDVLVVGKPQFNAYVKTVKVEEKNRQMDGEIAPLKCIV